MISISKGIIIKASSIEKIRLRPGKCSFENANAASMVVNVVIPTDETITRMELTKYLAKGAIAKARWKFTRLMELGSHCGGNLLISWVVLKADENIQMNGSSIIRPPIIRKR